MKVLHLTITIFVLCLQKGTSAGQISKTANRSGNKSTGLANGNGLTGNVFTRTRRSTLSHSVIFIKNELTKTSRRKQITEQIRLEAIKNNEDIWEEEFDINEQDNDGNTLLHVAVKKDFFTIVDFLLKKGALVNAKDYYGETALDLAKSLQPKNDKIINLLENAAATEVATVATISKECEAPPKPTKNNSSDEYVLDLLLQGEKEINLGGSKDVVLILGLTGSGKTTLTQKLAGNPSLRSVMVSLTDFIIIDEGNKISRENTVSKTLIPELVIINKTNTAIYDCPGFSDTRSTAHDIAMSYFIKKVIDHVDKVKLVFTIAHSNVKKGRVRDKFPNLIKHAVSLVKSVDKFKDGIALIVTKVVTEGGRKVSDDMYKMAIGTYIDEVKMEYLQKLDQIHLSTDEKLMLEESIKFLNILLTKNNETDMYTKIGISRSPQTCGYLNETEIMGRGLKDLEDLYTNRIEYIQKLDTDFGYSISDKSKIEVSDIAVKINKNISSETRNIVDNAFAQLSLQLTQSENISEFNQKIESVRYLLSNKLSIFKNGSLSTPEKFVIGIKDIFVLLNISVEDTMFSNIIKLGNYLSFLEIVSCRKLNTLPLEWTKPVDDFITKLTIPQNWYHFIRNAVNIESIAEEINRNMTSEIQIIMEMAEEDFSFQIQQSSNLSEFNDNIQAKVPLLIVQLETRAENEMKQRPNLLIRDTIKILGLVGIVLEDKLFDNFSNLGNYLSFLEVVNDKPLGKPTGWFQIFDEFMNYLITPQYRYLMFAITVDIGIKAKEINENITLETEKIIKSAETEFIKKIQMSSNLSEINDSIQERRNNLTYKLNALGNSARVDPIIFFTEMKNIFYLLDIAVDDIVFGHFLNLCNSLNFLQKLISIACDNCGTQLVFPKQWSIPVEVFITKLTIPQNWFNFIRNAVNIETIAKEINKNMTSEMQRISEIAEEYFSDEIRRSSDLSEFNDHIQATVPFLTKELESLKNISPGKPNVYIMKTKYILALLGIVVDEEIFDNFFNLGNYLSFLEVVSDKPLGIPKNWFQSLDHFIKQVIIPKDWYHFIKTKVDVEIMAKEINEKMMFQTLEITKFAEKEFIKQIKLSNNLSEFNDKIQGKRNSLTIMLQTLAENSTLHSEMFITKMKSIFSLLDITVDEKFFEYFLNIHKSLTFLETISEKRLALPMQWSRPVEDFITKLTIPQNWHYFIRNEVNIKAIAVEIINNMTSESQEIFKIAEEDLSNQIRRSSNLSEFNDKIQAKIESMTVQLQTKANTLPNIWVRETIKILDLIGIVVDEKIFVNFLNLGDYLSFLEIINGRPLGVQRHWLQPFDDFMKQLIIPQYWYHFITTKIDVEIKAKEINDKITSEIQLITNRAELEFIKEIQMGNNLSALHDKIVGSKSSLAIKLHPLRNSSIVHPVLFSAEMENVFRLLDIDKDEIILQRFSDLCKSVIFLEKVSGKQLAKIDLKTILSDTRQKISTFEEIANNIMKANLDSQLERIESILLFSKNFEYQNMTEGLENLKNKIQHISSLSLDAEIAELFNMTFEGDQFSRILIQEQYLSFLESSIFGNELSEPLIWSKPLVKYLSELEKEQQWYEFLVSTYNQNSEYQVQSNNSLSLNSVYIPDFEQGKSFKFYSKELAFLHSVKEYNTIENKTIDECNYKMFNQTLNFVFDKTLTSSCSAENGVVFKGNFVKLSDVYKEYTKVCCPSPRKLISIFAADTIFIDDNFVEVENRLSVSIVAPKWNIIGTRSIILDGKDGIDHGVNNGTTETGEGEDGKPGAVGGSAGNFFGVGLHYKNGDQLTISCSGGNGGPGQNGGNGKNGKDGKGLLASELPPANSIQLSREFNRLGHRWDDSFTKWQYYYPIYRVWGRDGNVGERGGNGGRHGFGGKKGNLYIVSFKGHTANMNLRNLDGVDGAAGNGGKGGLGGKRGLTLQASRRDNYLPSPHYVWVDVHTSDPESRTESGSDGASDYATLDQEWPEQTVPVKRVQILSSYLQFLNHNPQGPQTAIFSKLLSKNAKNYQLNTFSL